MLRDLFRFQGYRLAAEAVVQAEAPSELRAACQRVVQQPNESVGLGVGLPDGERIVQEIPVDRVRLSRRDVDAVFTRLSRDAAVRITLPRRDTIKDAAHDWLWIVRKDELDVPRLVKLKVGQQQPSPSIRPVMRSGRKGVGNARGGGHAGTEGRE